MSQYEMTFFERFEADILSGKKTITIRDEAEKITFPTALYKYLPMKIVDGFVP